MIRLYSICRIYLALASIYYLWYISYFALTDPYTRDINHIAFLGVYWLLAVILLFYFRFIYIITFRRLALACGWSFINILLLDWMLTPIYFYFFYFSLLLIPFSIYEVYRISEKMKSNIRGLDENGDEFEMDYEEYAAMQEEEVVEDEACNNV